MTMPARYVQWKAVLRTSGNGSPTLDEVTVSYLNQKPATAYPFAERSEDGAAGLQKCADGRRDNINASPSVSFAPRHSHSPPGKLHNPTWQADDPNGDQLVYTVYVRATDEREWHLLKDKIHQATYTIDSTALADGKYLARLVASDEESNPPNLERKPELLSAPFWVDNTPPTSKSLRQTVTGSTADVQFSCEGQHVLPYGVRIPPWMDRIGTKYFR